MDERTKSRLGRAVVMVLRPLLRVLIRNEITAPDFTELARQAYVDVASEHFAIEGKKPSYARVAVLTGLNRKEVVRLSALRDDPGQLPKSTPNRAQRVVNGWLSDPEFLTARGKPRVLPLQGESASFAALVSRHSGDITLGAVLDELLRVKLVSRDAADRIRLEQLGYVPSDDELEQIRVMAICATDLLETAVHNIEHGDVDRKFQRQLVYPSVEPQVAAAFRERSAPLSADYLQQLNRLLASLRDEAAEASTQPSHGKLDGDAPDARKRVGFGLYYFDQNTGRDDGPTR